MLRFGAMQLAAVLTTIHPDWGLPDAGDASSCTRVTAVREEGPPRSDASEQAVLRLSAMQLAVVLTTTHSDWGLPDAGDASSCTRVTAVKEEGTPRSDTSEPPSPKCKRRPRRKTEMWRMNNQLAQKRFRQKQKARSPPTAFGSVKAYLDRQKFQIVSPSKASE